MTQNTPSLAATLLEPSPLYFAFREFHFDNPEVFHLMVEFSRQMKNAGRKVYSIGSITERVRWHVDIHTKSPDGFKIANAHRAFYSRLIMITHQDLDGFFNLTKQNWPTDMECLKRECWTEWNEMHQPRTLWKR